LVTSDEPGWRGFTDVGMQALSPEHGGGLAGQGGGEDVVAEVGLRAEAESWV
jgi:hypothetical protein